jgi:hypothetical protein
MVSEATYGTEATNVTNGHGPAVHVHTPSDATAQDRDLPAPPAEDADFEGSVREEGTSQEEDPYDGIEEEEQGQVWRGSKIPVSKGRTTRADRDTLPPSPKPDADVPEVESREPFANFRLCI